MNMSRTITPQALKENIDIEKNILLLDVRRNADYEADREMIPGAVRHDPEQVDQWAQEIPKDKDVVVYCIRGGSVSNSVVDKLIATGISARYIEGGWEAWKKSRRE
jgi:rhodanese-related sulfurtransferase